MSFVGLYTGLSGVRAAQVGIDITSHNVANAATPGYTRQRVELAARPTYQAPGANIGTGVDVTTIGRLRDGFLDARFRTAVADHAASSVRGDLLGRLEQLTGEPQQGVSTRLTRLWEAAESWANNPADPATRRQVLSELSSVSDTLRSTAAAWDALEADVTSRRDTQVAMVNKTLESLAALDQRIADTDPTRVGPDLYDQRDLLLDEVARLTGGEVRIDTEGRALVTVPGADGQPVDLLRTGERAKLFVDADAGSIAVVTLDATDADGAPVVAAGGEIGGLHQVLSADLPQWRRELDAFTEAFVAAVNGVNAGGAVADGDGGSRPGDVLMTFEPGNAAASVRLADGVGVGHLAAGALPTTDGVHDPSLAPAPNDGRNARLFADLRTARLDADGNPTAGGSSLENRLADLVVGLAADVRAAKGAADGARAVSVGAELARLQEHGVSLDEEMVGLVRYQRSLEAASRVMTAVDEALDVLINRTGIVGR
ncbi:flagellar hook-associated protein FlgK [Egicoccus halophilus]|uniref:Flagellar hook-associated protein 1 n=1 Tax=Egicoccus halophilus TaxID=1670830 RepID=A0A8J3AE49_9ACTN|nr:flagellar hook-associated protein FlgK [Egicoccus halophilus]GGI06665.1 flagellar hook-associated protein 1 [Egicoccus halophilus]